MNDSSRTSQEADRAAGPQIDVSHLSVAYGPRTVLRDVCLEIPSGQTTAIIGPSGSGKSSLLMALNRLTDLIPTCSVDGQIRIGSSSVLEPATDLVALRRRVAMIFQQPTPFPLSIRGNLELPLREHGTRNRQQIAARSQSALQAVGLWDEVADRLDAPALNLSGGQQQRLCLARALVLDPEVLLLDEPCSSLDPLSTELIEGHLRELARRLTLVIVTHNLAQARRLADRVAFFWIENDVGRLVEAGPAEQIFTNPQHDLTRSYVTGRTG